MITPKNEELTLFQSENEELEFLRGCGLVSAKAVKTKLFCYKGAYVKWPVFCSVVGKTESGTAVLELGNELHCISTDYLSEMQGGTAKLYKDACEIRPVDSFVCFDVETTGLSAASDRIIEFGAVKYINGREANRFQSLVNPGFPISSRISELTGITNAELKDAPSIGQVLPKFLSFIGSLPLVAHNAPFDMGFLRSACSELSLCAENTCYDTLVLSREVFPGLGGYKLQDLIKVFSLDAGRAHRALFDAAATAQLFCLCRSSPFAPTAV